MRILLISPCYPHRKARYCPELNPGIVAPPLGLAYIASAIQHLNIQIKVVDMVLEDWRPEDITHVLNEFRPDIVGISCNMAFVSQSAIAVSKEVNRHNPDTVIIMGGNHATFCHADIIRSCPEIDYIVLGEGEIPFAELIVALQNGEPTQQIPGIVSKGKDGKIIVNQQKHRVINLDSLRNPARHLLQIDRYGPDSRGILIGSRGCPYSCAYCSTSAFSGKRIRMHSVDRVVDEMQNLSNKYSINHLIFVDDTFTINKKRVYLICEKILQKSIKVTWACDTRVDLVDRPLLEQMYKAGCRSIFFGIESANQEALDMVGKKFYVEQAYRACVLAREVGIQVQQSFIVGLPGEDINSIEKIIDFVQYTRPNRVLLNFFIVYPGTPSDINPSDYGIVSTSEEWGKSEGAHPMVTTLKMTPDQVRRAYVKLALGLHEIGMPQW